MKLNVLHYNLRSAHGLDSAIESRILAMQSRLQIEEANVRLECRSESSPAFGAWIHLVTPGPDVVAEGRDHTIRAAVNKAMGEVEAKLVHREAKRLQRVRGNLQAPAARARNGRVRR